MVRFYEAYGIFHNLANQTNRQFEFCLEPGTVLTFDNWRLLHARSSLDWLSSTLWWDIIIVKILKVDLETI